MFSLALSATTIACRYTTTKRLVKYTEDRERGKTNGFEELRNVDLIVETLSPPRLEYKVSSESLSRCRFEWS
jgi:hypothetical protein